MELQTAQGVRFRISEADAPAVAQHTWHAAKVGSKTYIANSKMVYLHRFLTNPGPGLVCDHINGDPFNNERTNLRVCTQAENLKNKAKHATYGGKPASSVYKGVSKAGKSFVVSVKGVHKGSFKDEIEAARCYDREALAVFGQFAKLNFAEAV